MFFKSHLRKFDHLFRNIGGIVESIGCFKVKNLWDQFTSSTCNLKNIFGFIKFEHIAESIKESLWSRIKSDIQSRELIPLLFDLLIT